MKKHLAPSQSRSGVALVITLSLLVLITVLVVGFTVNMRTEHQASSAMTGAARAGLVAQSALAHAVSLLSANIPQPVPPIQPGMPTPTPVNWAVNPGLLTTVQETSTVRQIPLSSNPDASYISTASDANLNAARLDGSGYAILPTSDEMRVAWVPLLKDPAQAAGNTNPLVGRYAFWMDDESAKLNLNTAYGKPPTLNWNRPDPGAVAVTAANPAGAWKYAVGHPASLNLDVLGGLNVSDLAGGVTTYGGFNNIEAVKQYAGPQPDAFFNANKFNLTAWSRAPEFNAFGKSRFYMSRRVVVNASGAGPQLGASLPMFQFFRDKDAPIYAPTDENENGADVLALYYTAAGLSSFLARMDWPGMPATSFADKWNTGAGGAAIPNAAGREVGNRQADQFAWDMVAMSHFADGGSGTAAARRWSDFTSLSCRIPFKQTDPVSHAPVSVNSVNALNMSAGLGSLSGKAIIPAYPVPLIDEVCLKITFKPTSAMPPDDKLYMRVGLEVEFWLPPNYSQCDFPPPVPPATIPPPTLTFGVTYLATEVKQPGATAPIDAKQNDNKYPTGGSPGNGIKVLSGIIDNTATANAPNGTSMKPGDPPLTVLSTIDFNVRNTGLSPVTFSLADGPGFKQQGGNIHCNFKMRVYAGVLVAATASTPGVAYPTQLIPTWDGRDGSSAFSPPADEAVSPTTGKSQDFIEFDFDLDKSLITANNVITRSLEVADPRLSGLARAWTEAAPFKDAATQNDVNTIGELNNATTRAVAAGWDLNKFGYLDLSQASITADSKPPSIGLLSLLSTGSQRGVAGATPKLQPNPDPSQLPDWLLLDLLAPTVSAGNLSNLSLVNATAGKLNVNANLLPDAGKFASTTTRTQPFQALFQNTPLINPASVIDNILKHKPSSSSKWNSDGQRKCYQYPGEICEVAGVADTGATDWDKEAVIRNLASCITTKSNVFSVWGAAQAVKKKPGNVQYGNFEAGDLVTGEKRFQAIVERYVWPGKDNMAGNADTAAPTATYDKLSSSRPGPGQAPPYADPKVAWEPIDGPDQPTYPPAGTGTVRPAGQTTVGYANWGGNADPSNGSAYQKTTIENANNPAGALMKYRLISFRYLND